MAALIKIEGFDWIDHLDYVYTVSGTPITADNTNSRFNSGRILEMTANEAVEIPTQDKLSGSVGFAWQCTNIGSSTQEIIYLYGGPGNGHMTMGLQLTAASKLQIVDSEGTSIGTASTNTLSSNTWYYIEWLFECANAIAEDMVLKVDGIEWITDITNGIDSLAATPPTQGIDRVVLLGHDDGTTRFDDFYAGHHHSGLFGDMQIVSLVPTGDNTDLTNTWGGNDGNPNNNYQHVDETGNPDDDETYVYTTGDERLEMYRFGDLSVTANEIFGIELITRAKKSGAGDMFLGQNFLTNTGITEAVGGVQQLGASYAYIRTLVEENPDTTNRFSDDEVNNLHFGSKSYTGLASEHGY
jgi:hypothetical protein